MILIFLHQSITILGHCQSVTPELFPERLLGVELNVYLGSWIARGYAF